MPEQCDNQSENISTTVTLIVVNYEAYNKRQVMQNISIRLCCPVRSCLQCRIICIYVCLCMYLVTNSTPMRYHLILTTVIVFIVTRSLRYVSHKWTLFSYKRSMFLLKQETSSTDLFHVVRHQVPSLVPLVPSLKQNDNNVYVI